MKSHTEYEALANGCMDKLAGPVNAVSEKNTSFQLKSAHVYAMLAVAAAIREGRQ